MLQMALIGQINDGILLEHSIQELEIGSLLSSTTLEMARPALFQVLVVHDTHVKVYVEYEQDFTDNNTRMF